MPFRGFGDSHEAHLYRTLIKGLPHYAIFRINQEGIIESWNAGVAHVLGYSEEDFLGRSFADLFTADDRIRGVPEKELRVAASEGRSSDERWHVRKNGDFFYADGIVAPILSATGEITGFTKLLRDVTNRKLAEQEKDRLAARLSEMAHALDLTHTIIRGLDGTITVWTQGAEFLYGWSRSEAVGGRTHELLRTEFPESLQSINERLLEEGEWQGELTHATKEGKTVKVASHWAVHAREQDSDGVSVIEVNNDITALQATQAELEETNRKLARANAELVSFAYEVAHDVKAPLRGLSGFAALLSRTLDSSFAEQHKELLEKILQSSSKLEELIDALLEYATAGDKAGYIQPVALEQTIKQVQSNLSTVMAEAGASLSWGALPVVRAHPVRVLRLLQNLIGNAIKYARTGISPVVRLSAKRLNDQWQIDVEDNGIGIKPEDRETIFVPLKRLHGAEIDGAGLGLAICKRIVEGEGGRIWISSVPGAGSTFHFTIPDQY